MRRKKLFMWSIIARGLLYCKHYYFSMIAERLRYCLLAVERDMVRLQRRNQYGSQTAPDDLFLSAVLILERA
jgi:hypothetical protein